MKIFDTHSHLGDDVVFEVDVDEKLLLEVYKINNIRGSLIQPSVLRPYLDETVKIHDRIHEFIKRNPSYYGMISVNPHFNYAEIEAECERCVSKLNFISMKLHTTGYGCRPDSKDGMHLFEVASSLDIPVMIHTGGGDFGDPMRLKPALDTFKNINYIIAHAGREFGIGSSVELAMKYDNVFIEPSWVNTVGIKELLKTVGADKFMFSSDVPSNVKPALDTFRSACGDEKILEKLFYGTAANVFSLK